MTFVSAEQVKSMIQGREAEVLERCAGIPEEVLDGKNHPCPKCGGKDRFRYINQEEGTVFCNQCFNEKNHGPISAVMHYRGLTYPAALELIARELNSPEPFQQHQPTGSEEPATKKVTDKKYEMKTTFTPIYDTSGGPKLMRKSCFSVGKKPFGFDLVWNGYSYTFKADSDSKSKVKKHTIYEYTDGFGEPLYLVYRMDMQDGKKLPYLFHWQNGVYISGKPEEDERVPFNAPTLKECEHVFIVEGEKCAVALQWWLDKTRQENDDIEAVTCFLGGSGQFLPKYADWFLDKDVLIFPDNDEPGYKYARCGAEVLSPVVRRLRIFKWPEGTPEKWDIADEIKEKGESSRVLQGLAGLRSAYNANPARNFSQNEKPP
ncbi:MAG: hypothetical protein IJQ31_07655 [Thermoguttaceae bacterium]|nr:hypothetical protein [Thermoguttaceae bacterium]